MTAGRHVRTQHPIYPFTPENEQDLLRLHHAGDSAATARLLADYRQMIERIAQRLDAKIPTRAGIDYDDLIQAGSIGFLQALERYKTSCGVKLYTYAKHRVRGAMIDAIRVEDFVAKKARHMGCAVQSLNVDWGCPTNSPRHPMTTTDLSPLLHGDDWWASALRGLTRSERLAAELYFRHGRRMWEVGEDLGVSEAHASLLIGAALKFLRPLKDRPWSENQRYS
jgi:RNA polymerase sigma factor (sigma-70 family)